MVRWAAIGFTATVSLLIPAAWHATEADLPSDGALVRPPVASFTVGGVEVKVDVDRAAVAPGDEVTLRIVATSETPKSLALVIRETAGDSEPMERVARVPQVLARKSVTVKAAPGGGPVTEVSFRLPRSKGKQGGVSQYALLVEPARAPEDDELGDAPMAALVHVITHDPEAYSVAIEPPAVITPGEPFELTVRVKNPGKKAISGVHVELAPAPEYLEANLMGEAPLFGGNPEDWVVRPAGAAADAENAIDIATLAPGEEKLVRYRVEPGQAIGRFVLLASAWSEDAGNALDWKSIETTAPHQVAAK